MLFELIVVRALVVHWVIHSELACNAASFVGFCELPVSTMLFDFDALDRWIIFVGPDKFVKAVLNGFLIMISTDGSLGHVDRCWLPVFEFVPVNENLFGCRALKFFNPTKIVVWHVFESHNLENVDELDDNIKRLKNNKIPGLWDPPPDFF